MKNKLFKIVGVSILALALFVVFSTSSVQAQSETSKLQELIQALMSQLSDLQKRVQEVEKSVPIADKGEFPKYQTAQGYVTLDELPGNPRVACVLPELVFGKRGNTVSLLQLLLSQTGDYPEKLITGYYGRLTAEAVRRFKVRNSLPPEDGIATISALNKIIPAYFSDCSKTNEGTSIKVETPPDYATQAPPRSYPDTSELSKPPVITGVSGPTSLKINETGKWLIKVNDPANSYLSYDVNWGDGQGLGNMPGGVLQAYDRTMNQEMTLTHSYTKPGRYLVTFIVVGYKGEKAQNTMTVNVTADATSETSLKVTSPYQGQEWKAGANYVIKWNYPSFLAGKTIKLNVFLMKIDSEIGSARSLYEGRLGVSTVVPSGGEIPWQVPSDLQAGRYYIYLDAVSELDSKVYTGMSGTFTVASNVSAVTNLQIVSPEANSKTEQGKKVPIRWWKNQHAPYTGAVAIQLYASDKSQLVATITNHAAGGSFEWVVPGTLWGKYTIKVFAENTEGWSNPFEIIAPLPTDPTPRIAYWWSKVNQVILDKGWWASDPDGVSGADLDKLAYCKKWYPNTVRVEEYKTETIYEWKERGNLNSYTSPRMSYKCVEGISTGNLPDMTVVSQTISPASPIPKTGQYIKMETIFKNQGGTPAKFDIRYKNKTNNWDMGGGGGFSLNPGQSFTDTLGFSEVYWAVDGKNNVCITLDPENLVSESNEDNNEKCWEIMVGNSTTNKSPIISNVLGPKTLITDEVGTWSISAYDPEKGYLSYSVDWGDAEITRLGTAANPAPNQLTSFTHSYTKAGIYTVVVTVTDDKGVISQSSMTVTVKNKEVVLDGPVGDVVFQNATIGETTGSDGKKYYTPKANFTAKVTNYPAKETTGPPAAYRGFYELYATYREPGALNALYNIVLGRFYKTEAYPKEATISLSDRLEPGKNYIVEFHLQEYQWGAYDYSKILLKKLDFSTPAVAVQTSATNSYQSQLATIALQLQNIMTQLAQ